MSTISKIYHSNNTMLREVWTKHQKPKPPKKADLPKPVMAWNPKLRRYELVCSYEQRHIPKKAKFSWDPTKKTWHTDSVRKAVVLIRFALPGAKAQLTYFLTN